MKVKLKSSHKLCKILSITLILINCASQHVSKNVGVYLNKKSINK